MLQSIQRCVSKQSNRHKGATAPSFLLRGFFFATWLSRCWTAIAWKLSSRKERRRFGRMEREKKQRSSTSASVPDEQEKEKTINTVAGDVTELRLFHQTAWSTHKHTYAHTGPRACKPYVHTVDTDTPAIMFNHSNRSLFCVKQSSLWQFAASLTYIIIKFKPQGSSMLNKSNMCF